MNVMMDQLAGLGPEIALLVGAAACLLTGLVGALRRATLVVAVLTLLTSMVLVRYIDPQAALTLAGYVKLALAAVGLILLLVAASTPERLDATRLRQSSGDPGKRINPSSVLSGEFYAFFLLSLTGAMLAAGANDLVWLFLALELTSLPTYVMVATSRHHAEANEAGVKYFFLGAMSAAVFLYGFTLIYGATGSTDFALIRQSVAQHGLPPLMTLGLVLSLVGIAFKIAAVPMHFYAADVYQGAATPVSAFLAFVPKTAGFVAILAVLGLAGGQLPSSLLWLLWLMAALTMSVGNVLGLLQSNVKRLLAYSSIAHSGYMLVGVLAVMTPMQAGNLNDSSPLSNGAAAVLFYLVAYALATTAAFAILGCVESQGREVQELEDISGLARRHPALAATLLLALLSLIGLPPLVGFLGKIYLFGAAIQQGLMGLVIIAVLNSAVSAVYYLRVASACFFGEPATDVEPVNAPARQVAAGAAALAALALGLAGGPLVDAAARSARDLPIHAQLVPADLADDDAATMIILSPQIRHRLEEEMQLQPTTQPEIIVDDDLATQPARP